MNSSLEDRENIFQPLWEDGKRALSREWRNGGDGRRIAALIVELAADPPTPGAPDRHANEYGLKDELSIAWAARPLEVTREQGRILLVLEDPGGETLGPLLGQRVALESFLPLAIGVAAALAQVHQRGLIHKDIKPANVLVNSVMGQAWLTGFAIASHLPRERQAPTPPEVIAGPRAYMASERTGRMNRSVDSRSDLYALGVTLYEMLTGARHGLRRCGCRRAHRMEPVSASPFRYGRTLAPGRNKGRARPTVNTPCRNRSPASWHQAS
jgi:serine/threonine protein kinase